MDKGRQINMLALRQAIEVSWDSSTAYRGVFENGNPALGNCYPTARVVQHYFPKTEIVEGEIQTSNNIEKHFWNVLLENGIEYHIDLSWQQFPYGAYIRSWKIRDRETLGDGEDATRRVKLLLERVQQFLTH